MTTMTTERPRERIIETEWEIAAPVADVWRALTDAEWLTNWFPTEAKIYPAPGKGATVWTAWSAGNEEFSASIAEWEENRRLKLVYAEPTPAEDAETALREGRYFPFQIAADYHLRARGDATVLRLVHSGFAEDESWDWQYEATSRGWKFELGGLKHYLERHKGVPRFVAQARHALGDVAFDVAWQMLLGANGLAAQPPASALQPGSRYEFRVPGDGVLRGRVELFNPPNDFAGTVENLNDARLRLKIDRSCAEDAPEGGNDAVFFLSTYDVDEATRAEIQASAAAMMKRLFGER